VPSRGSTDAVLVARIHAGDQLALGHVYDAYAATVHGVARRVTRDDHLASDITQDVFTHLWQLPDRVDLTRGTLRAYLAVLAHRRAVDEVRRSERRARVESSAAPVEVEDGPELVVVEAAADESRRRRLASALAALPEDQRSALELAYFGGLTYRQVAQAQDIPEGTAKSRLRLAMSRLRAVLEEEVVR
jgi:RNA polymerase sigma-70 factor (ECF subfamily)